jgi:hypothetical protein
MADRKKSFVMYTEYLQHFELLTKCEQADLIMLILNYVNGMETDTDSLSGEVKMAFSFIKARIDEDRRKYEEICGKRSEAARSAKARSAKAGNCIQMQANAADNDIDIDIDNDTDCDNDTDNDCDNDIVVVVDNEVVVENENDTAPEIVVVVVGEGEAQPLTSAAVACPDGLTTTTTTFRERKKELLIEGCIRYG